MIVEARELNISYDAIVKIAKKFQDVNIQSIFNIEEILKLMGAKIINMSAEKFEKDKSFFCAYSENNFTINSLEKNDDKLKRVFLAQGLGHYVLHSQRGKNPCKVSTVNGTVASTEGFLFSLALLLPDEIMIKMIKDGFNNEQIANMFRVPKKIVEIKLSFLKNKNNNL